MNSNPQIILRTAFDVRSYRNKKSSPVSDNSSRREQYYVGSRTFQEVLPNFLEYDIVIIDNTVSTIEEIPAEFRELWKHAKIIITGTNRFGKFNKGAGDVETLRFAIRNGIINTDFLFYELRIKTTKPNFITDFLDSPRNLISLEKGLQSVRSGYIGFEFATAVKFYNSLSPLRMAINKTSIEDLLFKYWTNNSLEFFPYGTYALRFDPWADKYISY